MGRKRNTAEGAYGYPLRQVFLPWCAAHGITEIGALTTRTIERYQADVLPSRSRGAGSADGLGVQQMIRQAVHDAGIKKRFHPHLFRYSAPTWMKKGVDPLTIARVLGWTSLRMLQRIYDQTAALDDYAARARQLREGGQSRTPHVGPSRRAQPTPHEGEAEIPLLRRATVLDSRTDATAR